MSILSFLGLLVGSLARSPWTQWWNQGIGPFPMPQGTPPTDYTPLTQPQLLAQFSDAIGPSGITPRSLRNLVASVPTSTPGGVPVTAPIPLPGWTTATRPNMAGAGGPFMGFNYTLQQFDVWDNEAGEWVNPSFSGGYIPGSVTFGGAVSCLQHVQMNAGGNVNGGFAIQGNIQTWLPSGCYGLLTGQLYNNGNNVSIAS